MLNFLEEFRELSNEELTLKIIEKNPGNEVMIPYYYYSIYKVNTGEFVGKISIRIGHNYHSYYNGHIGYEIEEPHRGHRYALVASKLVLQVAKAHEMEYLYLTCTANNEASKKTIQLLGGTLIEACDLPRDYFGWRENAKPQCIYKLEL